MKLRDHQKKFIVNVQNACRDYLNKTKDYFSFLGSLEAYLSNWNQEVPKELQQKIEALCYETEHDYFMYEPYPQKRDSLITEKINQTLSYIDTLVS